MTLRITHTKKKALGVNDDHGSESEQKLRSDSVCVFPCWSQSNARGHRGNVASCKHFWHFSDVFPPEMVVCVCGPAPPLPCRKRRKGKMVSLWEKVK